MKRPPRYLRSKLCVHELETRTVPATLVSPTTLTYQDADGDSVKVSFSKPILTDANVNTVFNFSAGTVNGDNTTLQQLTSINLTGITEAARTSITLKSEIANGGDGFANVGEIDATGLDLGTVTLDGDLGQVDSGDGDAKFAGLLRLNAQSIGKFGTTTGAPHLVTRINGAVGGIFVVEDIKEMDFYGEGKLGGLSIGGSLLGGGGNFAGSIAATAIGNILIGGDIAGSTGLKSGTIYTFNHGNIGNVTIKGEVLGGIGDLSGQLTSAGSLGNVKITGDIKGSVGQFSGVISAATTLRGLSAHVVSGGLGDASGRVQVDGASGPIKVESIAGGAGPNTGVVSMDSGASVTVGFSVGGGNGPGSGQIRSANLIKSIKIDHPLYGGSGNDSGRLQLGSVGTLSIGSAAVNGIDSSLIGGIASGTGVVSVGDARSIRIKGHIIGGFGARETGSIVSRGEIKSLIVDGFVSGGSADGVANMIDTGSIFAKRIGSLTIKLGLSSGTDTTTGNFSNNGAIRVVNDIGRITIGDIIGNATNPAIISAGGQATPKGSKDLAIGSITVNGSVRFTSFLAGVDKNGAPVNADAQIGSVTVKGDWISSSLIAGVTAGDNGYFGDGDANEGKMTGGVKDEATVFSKIGPVKISGQAKGSDNAGDFYAIMAEHVKSLKVGVAATSLIVGNSNDNKLIGTADDFKVLEV